MMKIILRKFIPISLLILFSQLGFSQIVVIANPAASAKMLTPQQASAIFLGKAKKFPGGGTVIPIDQEKGEAARDEFYTKVVKKDEAQLNAYWSRLVFTGKGQPPRAVLDDEEVVDLVSNNPDIIGYVNEASVTDGVVVLLKAP